MENILNSLYENHSSNEITLWAGDVGTKLDAYGNVSTVHKNNPVLPIDIQFQFINLFQTLMEEYGFTIETEIKEVEEINPYGEYAIIYYHVTPPDNFYRLPKTFAFKTTLAISKMLTKEKYVESIINNRLAAIVSNGD